KPLYGNEVTSMSRQCEQAPASHEDGASDDLLAEENAPLQERSARSQTNLQRLLEPIAIQAIARRAGRVNAPLAFSFCCSSHLWRRPRNCRGRGGGGGRGRTPAEPGNGGSAGAVPGRGSAEVDERRVAHDAVGVDLGEVLPRAAIEAGRRLEVHLPDKSQVQRAHAGAQPGTHGAVEG